MVDIEAVEIEIAGDDPARLAPFYERLFGFEIVEATDAVAVLRRPGVLLRIRLGEPGEGGVDGASVGFVVAPSTDLEALRGEAVAAGAIVLSESKRADRQSLRCQDPAGNDLSISLARSEPTPGVRSELVVRGTAPTTVPRSASPPTRRDFDRLHDEARLAQMKEGIAGLGGAFGPDDPETIMSDMRAKLGAAGSEIDNRVAAADRELRARERESDADALLARYKKELVDPAEPGTLGPSTDPGEEAEPDPVSEIRLHRPTLGRAPDEDEDLPGA